MKIEQVIMVRVYLSESEHQVDALVRRLHDWEKVRGVTVFRGIAGFGTNHGTLHTAKLVELSLDLPLVVEFFDAPDKVANVIQHIAQDVKPLHMVWWSANTNV